MAADATFLIPRITSHYGLQISHTCVERKIRAYHRRWPASMACVKGETRVIGLVQVIGRGEVDEMTFRHQGPSARSFSSRHLHGDPELPSVIDETPAFDMTDRSTAFATDHGSASWLRTSLKATTSRRRGDTEDVDLKLAKDSQYSATDLAQLYVRHPPTLCSVRKALLKAKGNLNPRSIVELEGKRPPSASNTTGSETTSSQTLTSSPKTASPASSSPFSLNASSRDITILRQKRQGGHTILVPVPYSVPKSRLTNRRLDVDEGWNTPGTLTASPGSAESISRTSYAQSNKRSAASQPETDPHSTNLRAGVGGPTSGSALPQRTKGLSMFKKLKRD
jgi:hypothetical protein